MNKISIRDGSFNTGEDIFEDAIEVVVVNAAPVTRAYYKKDFNPNVLQKPVCWSTDTQQPANGVTTENLQALRCVDCSQNIRGSAAGGGRACRFSQKIAVVFEDKLDVVYQMQVPASSIFGRTKESHMPLQEYARFLQKHGTSSMSVYTKIYFDTNSMVPKLFFTTKRPLEKEELTQVSSMVDHENTVKAITTDYSSGFNYFSSEENNMIYPIQGAEALWPKLDRPYVFDDKANHSVACSADTKNAKYSVELKLNYEEALKLRKEMKKFYDENKEEAWPTFDDRFEILEGSKKEKNAVFKVKTNIAASYNSGGSTKPKQLKANLEPLPEDFQLTTGSVINIEVSFYAWANKQMGCGVTLRPRAIQVITLAEREATTSFTAQEGYGSDEDKGHSFTAVGSEPAKTAEVVEEDEWSDEPEEPKKVVKNKNVPPKDDSLDKLIDDWDE